MSRPRRGSHHRPGGEQDFELNIASVIDCFTVLITYMLASASFISISALDIDIAGAGDLPVSQLPQVSVSVFLNTGRGLIVKISGAQTDSWSIAPNRDGDWDLDSLSGKLKELQEKWPSFQSALVGADDSLEYKEVVKVVETAKRVIPSLTLGDRS